MRAPHARGFTLLETVLASVIAGMVLVVAGGLFAAINVADRASATALNRTTEFSITQGAIRRAFLRLVVAGDREVNEGEALPRPRLLLEPDAAGLGAPRFEVVVSKPPVGSAMGTTGAEWAFASQDDASLNFVSADGAGGQERGVFELRPDGQRERAMTSLGLESPWWDAPPEIDESRVRTQTPMIRNAAFAPGQSAGQSTGQRASVNPNAQGWTLWYRRMLPEEVALLDQGFEPPPDGAGEPELEARRLAGAVRLATGLTEARWRVFKSDEWVNEYSALMTRDLPAFVQFRARAKNGTFGEWLFEIGWTESENVGTDQDAVAFGGGPAGADDAGGAVDPADPNTAQGEGDAADPATNPSTRPGSQDDGRTLPSSDDDSAASGGTSVRLRRDDQ